MPGICGDASLEFLQLSFSGCFGVSTLAVSIVLLLLLRRRTRAKGRKGNDMEGCFLQHAAAVNHSSRIPKKRTMTLQQPPEPRMQRQAAPRQLASQSSPAAWVQSAVHSQVGTCTVEKASQALSFCFVTWPCGVSTRGTAVFLFFLMCCAARIAAFDVQCCQP